MPQVTLSELVQAAVSGESLISFPTDTVPALASRPDRAGLIYAAKQRSETKPLILMAADVIDLWDYVQGSDAEQVAWEEMADRYFPGAITLVLPANDRLPKAMNPTDPTTIGIRVPKHPIARQILRLTRPLATTSVNRSGEPPLLNMDTIDAAFPEVYTLSPAALKSLESQTTGPSMPGSGKPSTVVKWTGQGWEILRQGEVVLEPF